MEVSQTASRPRSRSQVLKRYSKTQSQGSRETPEFLQGDRCRSVSRNTVTTSVTPTSSETVPIQRAATNTSQEQDVLREIQKRYKIDPIPTIQQFRVSKTVAGYKLTADVMKPRNEVPYLSLGMKVGEDPLFFKKVLLTPQYSDIRVYSSPMELGFLRLQFSVGYDWKKNNLGASWRCKTKWTKGSKIQKKLPIYNGKTMELNTFWNFRQEFPQIRGRFGPSSSSFSQDIGRMHLDFHRLKACVNL